MLALGLMTLMTHPADLRLGIMDLKVVTVSGHTQTQNTFPYIFDIIQMP